MSGQQKILSEGEALVFKLPEYTRNKEKDERFCFEPFYTHPGGYKMRIRIYANGRNSGAGTHLSIFIEVLESCHDGQLQWPFNVTVTFELLNQLADARHYKKSTILTAMNLGSVQGNKKFFPHSSLCHDPATDNQYLLDDTLYFRVSVKVDKHKPWLVCTDKINMTTARALNSMKTLKNGKYFAFKIIEYNAQKTDNIMFISDSFYTSPGGYQMCIIVWPNGDDSGKGTHVSVYATLLEGSFDASLSCPFQGSVTITLLNQLSDENHHIKILQYRGNDGNGYEQFISQSSLSHDPVQLTEYLKNDTLHFRVSVKDELHKPWLVSSD